MKKTILLFALLAVSLCVGAQSFIHAVDDPMGDHDQPLSPDAKTFSYAIDPAADSVWFKFDFYHGVDNDAWSLKLGLDTNLNPADGGTWPGNNTSMHYELEVAAFYNPNFPPFAGYIVDHNQTYISSNVSCVLYDSNTAILGLKLSEVAPNGDLNVVAGAGLVVGSVNDDLPDSGFVTLSDTGDITGAYTQPGSPRLNLYPNPATDMLMLDAIGSMDDMVYEILDLRGNLVRSGMITSRGTAVFHIGALETGLYLLRLQGKDYGHVQMFSKF